MKKRLLLFTLSTLTVCGMAYHANADLTIASNGKSTFTIVIPANAPDSVNAAAQELRRDLEESTKAKIPILNDGEKANGAIISLGSTAQAKAAGFDAAKIPDSGFRIVTKNGNLYIIGLDTAAKINQSRKYYGDMTPQPEIDGPQYTKDGGWSNGTANGVYTFLEDYLGVRWLMPGELGRDVPAKSTFTIPDLNRSEAPEFIYRHLGLLQKYTENIPAIADWQNRQKLGFSTRIDYNHSWWRTLNRGFGGDPRSGQTNTDAVKKAYAEHPDWFAMDANGKRPFPKNHYASLETTNQDLVKWFADQAIATLKAEPQLGAYSLSPSDGRGWSESPESKKYYEPSPSTIFDPESTPGAPSITPLILKWYRDVSDAVAKEYPQGKLAGYIYSDYLFPPQKGDAKLPENFIPVIAPSFDYGYKLYRSDVQQKFDYVMDNWAKVAPSTWFYYDLPNQIMSPYQSGIVMPPATGILNFIFPRLLKNHIKGSIFYGNTSWSNAAMSNYISAKLLWNPKLNADDLQREWLTRAYGQQAAAVMEEFYGKLDGWFNAFYNKYDYYSYHAREPLFSQLYAPHYAEMEQLFLKAAAQPMTPAQQARLNLLRDNLIVLRWRMVNAGYIKADAASPLKRDSAQVADLMFDGFEPRQTADKAFDLFPVLWYQDQPAQTMVNVVQGEAPQAASKTLNAGYILLYANQAGKITIHPQDIKSGSAFIGWRLSEPKNSSSFRLMQQGLFYEGGDISFDAKANSLYLLRITPQGFVSPKLDYTLIIPNATVSSGTFGDETLYLQNTKAPVSVFVPKGLDVYADDIPSGARLRTMIPAEAARAVALKENPGSKVLLTLDTNWRFINQDGDYSKSTFDDSTWKTIDATDTWQSQGYPNYHGVAWYRKTITLKTASSGKVLLHFGAVDGDAVVYVNGQKVGEHSLGSHGEGWDQPFEMDVTPQIKAGKNVIAVQVTKLDHASGIYKGVGLLEITNAE